MTGEIENAINNMMYAKEEAEASAKSAYVSAVMDMLVAVEECMEENSQGNRQLFYGRLNPKIDALIKANACGYACPEWPSRVAERIKCSMCDRGGA